MSNLLPTTRRRALPLIVKAVCVLALAMPGCGGSETAAENASPDQQKAQELLKKGMTVSQIRKTLRGEPIDAKPAKNKKKKPVR